MNCTNRGISFIDHVIPVIRNTGYEVNAIISIAPVSEVKKEAMNQPYNIVATRKIIDTPNNASKFPFMGKSKRGKATKSIKRL